MTKVVRVDVPRTRHRLSVPIEQLQTLEPGQGAVISDEHYNHASHIAYLLNRYHRLDGKRYGVRREGDTLYIVRRK